jgi:hypothetical protein
VVGNRRPALGDREAFLKEFGGLGEVHKDCIAVK